MNLTLIIQLIPLIIQLISFAEKFFTQPKSGATKKEFVVNTVKTLYSGASSISTGKQAETLKAIEPLLDPMINFSATLLFPSTSSEN